MKVINKRSPSRIAYREVEVGKVFENDGIYFMKTNIEDKSVFLSTVHEGTMAGFDPDDEVTIVNTTLMIEGE